MSELHRVSRRLFLTDLGRTVAIAVVGTGVLAACSPGGVVTTEAAGSTDADQAAETDVGSASATEALRWERVQLGFVSAYVLGRGDNVAIVDTGTSGSAPQIAAALDVLGADWADVSDVVLTHLHGDHVGGLPGVVDFASSATVWAGAPDAAAINAVNDDDAIASLNDGDEVFGLQVIATPGHTPGHICVLDPDAGFLVAGDALNEDGGMVLGPNPSFTADMATAHASVQRLAEREYETVVFGHGEPIVSGGSDAVVGLAQTL